MTETTIRVGDLVFTATVDGPRDGPPSLLLHGFPASRASWRPLVPRLVEAGMRVVAPDQRGYSPGARPQGREAYRIEHLVRDVVGMLDELELPAVHLVGHDWGGIVAWFVAVRQPDRVLSLTAVSVPHPAAFGWALAHDPAQQAGSAYIKLLRQEGKAEQVLLEDRARRLRGMFRAVLPPGIEKAHVELLSDPVALTGALSWYRAMTADFADLGPATVPTTYVWGAADEALARAGAERCGEFVTGDYRFVELPDIGHWVPELAPEVLADEILRRVSRDA